MTRILSTSNGIVGSEWAHDLHTAQNRLEWACRVFDGAVAEMERKAPETAELMTVELQEAGTRLRQARGCLLPVLTAVQMADERSRNRE
jgi:hypothetical protein